MIFAGIISAVGSFIGGAISSIGSAIGGFASGVLNVVSKIPILETRVGEIITAVAKIVHSVAELLGIESEDDPEILGAKAEQSDKKLEDFDNDVEAYIKYLKEEVEFDKVRFEKLTQEERLGCKAIGMALETKAVEEKIGGVTITPECLATLAKIYSSGINIDAKVLLEVVKALKEQGITDLSDVSDYLSGTGQSDRVKTGEAILAALGDGASDKIIELKSAVRKCEIRE